MSKDSFIPGGGARKIVCEFCQSRITAANGNHIERCKRATQTERLHYLRFRKWPIKQAAKAEHCPTCTCAKP